MSLNGLIAWHHIASKVHIKTRYMKFGSYVEFNDSQIVQWLKLRKIESLSQTQKMC